jgi:integrase
MGQKNVKGSVSIVNAEGRIRLRWRYQKKRYSLNLFHYSRTSLIQAKKIAAAIENDMLTESFDFTLSRYKPSSHSESKEPKLFVELFIDWVKQYRHRDCDKDVDYYLIKRMLERWGNFNLREVLIRLNKEPISAKTYNARLRILRAFLIWGCKFQVLECNPLEDVKAKKLSKTQKKNRKPFSVEEISLILSALKNDTFCPVSSRYKHSIYYPFVYFIFQMGVRPAEAVGLRVRHLDLNNKVVEIKEAMARTMKGTHAAARVRKETKNGKERRLPLDEKTISLLKPLIEGKQADDLVFQSPTGLPVDDRMFQRRVFRKVLKELKLEERVLYACRHTFGSRCIHEGLTPVMTAFLMGNNPETALRNYTHLIELPKGLPSINNDEDN